MDRRLLLLMIAAPATVAALVRSLGVPAVFVVYQVGICLVLPAVIDRGVRRWSWRRHCAHLGLVGPGAVRGFGLGLGLGAVGAAAVLVFFAGWGDARLTAAAVAEALHAWGLPTDDLPALLVFMALVSGPAEELFWRGFCAGELAACPSRFQRLVVPSLLYASYHTATIPVLMPHPPLAAAALAAVAAAGLAWAWLRERSGSLWPALLSHGAVAGAYVLVALRLVQD